MKFTLPGGIEVEGRLEPFAHLEVNWVEHPGTYDADMSKKGTVIYAIDNLDEITAYVIETLEDIGMPYRLVVPEQNPATENANILEDVARYWFGIRAKYDQRENRVISLERAKGNVCETVILDKNQNSITITEPQEYRLKKECINCHYNVTLLLTSETRITEDDVVIRCKDCTETCKPRCGHDLGWNVVQKCPVCGHAYRFIDDKVPLYEIICAKCFTLPPITSP